ncbi:unnamed protein product [Psylliodes chrysocephalus]|nr:unnamed protein product [Psylliodes chrysocephala]
MMLFFLNNGQLAIAETIYNPYFHFPGGSEAFMGIIVTIAIPVDANTPGEVLLSTILEGNYLVPTNETEFEYPPNFEESSERAFFYEILKRKIEDFGYSGKKCLLRTVCEAAQMSSLNTGVLGDIVHVLLSPSSSKMENTLKEYEDAESLGKNNECKYYEKLCPYSILNAISKIKLMSLLLND